MAPPGTANKSAISRVHVIRPKCRRLMLQALGLMVHEIHAFVIGASVSLGREVTFTDRN